jgi:hypothetical protein
VGFWFVEVFVNSFIDDLAYIGEAHSSVRILGFRRGVCYVCYFLGFYAAQVGNLLQIFRDSVSVLASKVKRVIDP